MSISTASHDANSQRPALAPLHIADSTPPSSGVSSPTSHPVSPTFMLSNANVSPVLASQESAEDKPIHVLLVEDNKINQKMALMILQKAKCRVDVAENGLEAVHRIDQWIAHHLPSSTDSKDVSCSTSNSISLVSESHHDSIKIGGWDVILMDMNMPKMGGVQASQCIRQRGCLIPIIALTANATPSDRDACIQAGMTDFLVKPFKPKEFVEKVKAHAATYRRSLGHSVP